MPASPSHTTSSSSTTLPPSPGTRDFAPADLRLRTWLFDHFAATSRLYGYEAFETPVLEAEALFTRKAGEEITGQLYSFEDKGGRRVALRPELTPSLARLALAQGPSLPRPTKWYTIGQCWRYERTTRGRRREHYQWNMDVLGVEGVAAEAELLAATVTFLGRVGLGPGDVVIRVSSRKVLQALMAAAGVPDDAFGRACVVVDKADKLPAEAVAAELVGLGMSPEAAADVLAAVGVTGGGGPAMTIDALAARLGDAHPAVAELRTLWALAAAAGFEAWLAFDPSCVRGLAYYTGIVFEGRDRDGALRAIFGGGRYDGLLSTYGGPPTPAAGFGFGDCVIAELLADKGLLPALAPAVDDLVVPLDPALRPAATALAARLRGAGRSVDLALEDGRKLKAVFKAAERCGAGRVILVGLKEWEAGCVRVKEQASREERDVGVDALVAEAEAEARAA